MGTDGSLSSGETEQASARHLWGRQAAPRTGCALEPRVREGASTMAMGGRAEVSANGSPAGAPSPVDEQLAKRQAKRVLGEYTKEMYAIDIVCFWVGCVLLVACAML